jgi:hypothetical protein
MIDVNVRQQHRPDRINCKFDFRVGMFFCVVTLKDSAVNQQASVVLVEQLVTRSRDSFVSTMMDKFHAKSGVSGSKQMGQGRVVATESYQKVLNACEMQQERKFAIGASRPSAQ